MKCEHIKSAVSTKPVFINFNYLSVEAELLGSLLTVETAMDTALYDAIVTITGQGHHKTGFNCYTRRTSPTQSVVKCTKLMRTI